MFWIAIYRCWYHDRLNSARENGMHDVMKQLAMTHRDKDADMNKALHDM